MAKPIINQIKNINQLLIPSSVIKYKFVNIPKTGNNEKLNLKLKNARATNTSQKMYRRGFALRFSSIDPEYVVNINAPINKIGTKNLPLI